MRIAIPTWQGTVSPVFDVARELLLVDVEAGVEQQRRVDLLNDAQVAARVDRLRRLSVDVLICGAVSRPLEQALLSAGVQVVPHVCGDVAEVLRAHLSGRPWDRAFLMPGCVDCLRRRGPGRRDR